MRGGEKAHSMLATPSPAEWNVVGGSASRLLVLWVPEKVPSMERSKAPSVERNMRAEFAETLTMHISWEVVLKGLANT